MLMSAWQMCYLCVVVVVVFKLPLSGDQQHGRDVYRCHVLFAPP